MHSPLKCWLGFGECCWCGRVQVSLGACVSPEVPSGTVPELRGEEQRGLLLLCSTRAAATCCEAGERIYVGLCGEGKPEQDRSTVR